MQHLRAQEVGHDNEAVARPDRSAAIFLNLASTSALDQVLNPGDPTSSFTDALRLARRYCGRWLALRRSHLRLSNQEIAERTDVDAQTLLTLELGLAETLCITDAAAERLSVVLADEQHDADLVAAVIDVARGRSDNREGVVMERVMDDLQPTLVDPEGD